MSESYVPLTPQKAKEDQKAAMDAERTDGEDNTPDGCFWKVPTYYSFQ